MTDPVIPAEAVEAAFQRSWYLEITTSDVREILEAAAPYMTKAAYDLGIQHGANQPPNPYVK